MIPAHEDVARAVHRLKRRRAGRRALLLLALVILMFRKSLGLTVQKKEKKA